MEMVVVGSWVYIGAYVYKYAGELVPGVAVSELKDPNWNWTGVCPTVLRHMLTS